MYRLGPVLASITRQNTTVWCTVNGRYSAWSCSPQDSCPLPSENDGSVLRIASCNSPAPANDGADCDDPAGDTSNTDCDGNFPRCVTPSCLYPDLACILTVDGNMTEWSCSPASCPPENDGSVAQISCSRSCTNPSPANQGAPCTGDISKVDPCPGKRGVLHYFPCYF